MMRDVMRDVVMRDVVMRDVVDSVERSDSLHSTPQEEDR
jgi:hypothetical protein